MTELFWVLLTYLPVKPTGQVQVKLAIPSTQVAPFSQWSFSSHQSISLEQSSSVYPTGQSQEYVVFESKQLKKGITITFKLIELSI